MEVDPKDKEKLKEFLNSDEKRETSKEIIGEISPVILSTPKRAKMFYCLGEQKIRSQLGESEDAFLIRDEISERTSVAPSTISKNMVNWEEEGYIERGGRTPAKKGPPVLKHALTRKGFNLFCYLISGVYEHE